MLSFNLIFSLCSAAIAPLLFGYHLAELNAPEAALRCVVPGPLSANDYNLNLPPCIKMTTADYGLATSIFAFGGLMGALLGGPMSNKYGRKGSLWICSVGFAIGGFLMALSPTLAALVAGRMVCGISAGSAVVVVPLYIHDLAPLDKKGSFGALTQISVNIGILLTQTLGLFLSKERLWRIILGVGGLLGVVQAIMLYAAFESPKWLVTAQREPEAIAALKAIRGHHVSDAEIHEELYERGEEPGRAGMDQAQESNSGERQSFDTFSGHVEEGQRLLDSQQTGKSEEKVSLVGFITQPEYRKALICVVGIMFAQQLTGINAIIMYGVSVLREVLPNSAALINVFISLTNLFFTYAASRYFDSAGRKPWILCSIAGMGINALFLGIGIIFHIPILSAITTILFVSSFSIGLGPIPWMVAAETVPFNASGAAQSISLSANWIGTFMVSYGFPIIALQIGKGNVFFLFSILAVFWFLFVVCFIPETKNMDAKTAWEEHAKSVDRFWNGVRAWVPFMGGRKRTERVD